PHISTLPNRAALRGLPHHRLPFLAAEGLVELGHVLHRPVHAERPLRVRVGLDAADLFLRRHVLAPHLRETEEETLLGREAVEGLARFALERLLVRAIRE